MGRFWPGASRHGGSSDPARAAMRGSFGQVSCICGSCPIFFFNLCVRGPSFQPNTWVWFMSITHCIIMVMHAMLFIMAGLVRLPASSSCRSFRNEFSGFGVFMLNPISVCGMPSAWTGASRCGGHFCHPGSFAQTSGALGAYCEIFIKDSCSHQA